MKARRSPPAAYEMLDHTADLGIEVQGESLSDLFAAAGAALADLMFDPAKVREREARTIRLEARSKEELMVRWLNELLYVREVEEFLWRSLEVEAAGETRLEAELHGEPHDPQAHVFREGLKAATYHQLRVARDGSQWSARIIIDV
jgi:SHS2 domain-containing protein